MNRGRSIADLGEDLGVLASMLGEERAYALADEAVPLLRRHRSAATARQWIFSAWAWTATVSGCPPVPHEGGSKYHRYLPLNILYKTDKRWEQTVNSWSELLEG